MFWNGIEGKKILFFKKVKNFFNALQCLMQLSSGIYWNDLEQWIYYIWGMKSPFLKKNKKKKEILWIYTEYCHYLNASVWIWGSTFVKMTSNESLCKTLFYCIKSKRINCAICFFLAVGLFYLYLWTLIWMTGKTNSLIITKARQN